MQNINFFFRMNKITKLFIKNDKVENLYFQNFKQVIKNKSNIKTKSMFISFKTYLK